MMIFPMINNLICNCCATGIINQESTQIEADRVQSEARRDDVYNLWVRDRFVGKHDR